MTMKRDVNDRILAITLAALAALYLVWYRNDPLPIAAFAFFALPPLLLSFEVIRSGSRLARFLAGVIALLWFSHGVMIAWAQSDQRGYALAEVALSVVIIFAANASALHSKFGTRKD